MMTRLSHFLHVTAVVLAVAAATTGGPTLLLWALALVAVAAYAASVASDNQLKQNTDPSDERSDTVEPASIEPPDAIVDAPPPAVDLAPALRALALELSRGDLSARLQSPEGADETTAKALNSAIADVNAAVDEALALADVASNGDLTARATGSYQGHGGALVKALNGLLDGLSQLAEALQHAVEHNQGRSARMAEVAASLNTRSRDQVSVFEAVEAEFTEICSGLDAASAGASASREAVEATVAAAKLGRDRISEAVAAISRVEQSSKEIDEVTDLIESISQQSQLLSVNASVEAARAGDAGKGFGIVANEMGSLGARTQAAAQRIAEIAKGSSVDTSRGAKFVAEVEDAIGRIEEASGAAAESSDKILKATRDELDRVARCRDQIVQKREDVRANLKLAATANMVADELSENVDALRRISGRFLINDDRMVQTVVRCATEASAALEQAVRGGEISMEALFSEDYQAIEGTNPQQFLTPYVLITDRYISPIIETVFDCGPGIAFGAIIDKNGFLPTHSRKFSKPQGADPTWNTANCRNRRFFTDRVGLACGKSTAAHLLQVYRRDMGGGVFATMKDISAPIIVRGKHWGGFRIGYRSAETADEMTPVRGEGSVANSRGARPVPSIRA